MRKYFIIFPHAGAIRSGYSEIERSVALNYDVIYIDYENYINEQTTFENFIKSIWVSLNRKILRKNADIIVFAHSMGNCIVQALESKLVSQYYVRRIIYSDGDVINKVPDYELRNRTEHELQEILDRDYDIPKPIKDNSILCQHFQSILVRDLYVLDRVQHYIQKYGHIELVEDVERSIVLSEYMNRENSVSDWNKMCKKKEFIFVNGGHYTILDEFKKYIFNI